MKEKLRVNRQALDGMLPGLPKDFEDDMRRMIHCPPVDGKEIVMKKKLSLGLALALILALLAIGALAAALLGGRAFTDSILAPKAQETTSDMFTPQEIKDILAIAAENGITLPDDLMARLQSGEEGYYKEELMRAFVKTELGFYPSCWSIADQAWYARLLVACKLAEYAYNVVPEGDEIPQEKALEIAGSAIRAQLDPAFDPNDAAYQRHMQYREYTDNPYHTGRSWDIEYLPLDLYHTGYYVALLSDGTVTEAEAFDRGIYAPGVTADNVLQRFRNQNGDAWTEADWIACRAAMDASIISTPGQELNKNVQAILRQSYVESAGAVTPREQAAALALDAAKAQYGACACASILYLQGSAGNAWKARLTREGESAAFAEINDQTGAVALFPAREIEYWARAWVLEENMPSEALATIPPAGSFPTTRPDGKMGLWGSAIAPDYFWQELDKIGYTSETGGDLMEKWQKEYGWDGQFWPLEYRAIDYVLHELSPQTAGQPVLHGLPSAADMPQVEALKLAWETFLASPEAGALGKSKAEALKPAVYFYFNAPAAGDHTWYIAFVDVAARDTQTVYGVTINAATGEIIGTGLYTPNGNG